MSLRKYEAFVKTVELGSLTKAAEALGSTQSRISHILNDLEAEYGFTLMQRNRAGIQLTEAGKLLQPIMEEILAKNRELEALAENIRNYNTGTLRLATFSSVAVNWLPGMLQAFQARCPQLEIQILSGDYDDIDGWLRRGEADIGFVTLPAPDGMNILPLAEDGLVAILPKEHTLAQYKAVPIREIGNEPFVSLRQSSNHDIHRALDKAGVRPYIRYSTKDDYALIAMVQQGLGVSIVPELLIGNRRDGIEVRPLSPPAYRTIALAYAKGTPLPAVQAFIQTAEQWLKEQQILSTNQTKG